MKKLALVISAVVLALYVLMVCVLYFVQERLIFFPQKLRSDHRFAFDQPFEELSFSMTDGIVLNCLLFPARKPKGLIFYLHGNAGSLETWGAIAGTYTSLGYDLFMLDYRGYGKSGGAIGSEAQLHADIRAVYDRVRARYRESDIIILGYSIGTGPAAKLASGSGAGRLILQAPYYSLAGVMASYYPVIPRFILKYRLETNKFITACRMPVTLIHGDRDAVISYQSSVRLQALLKPGDSLITLHGQGHNGLTENPQYRSAIRELLGK